MTPRPRRQKRADRLTNPDTHTPGVTASDMALAPLDRLARHYDGVWGIDRLPELVSPETAARYGSALGKLNAAIDAADPEQVALHVGAVMRGLEYMNAEAERNGAQKAKGDFIEIRNDKVHFAILKDDAEWMIAKEANPHIPRFVTAREVANAIAAYDETSLHPIVKSVVKQFPNATITKIKPKHHDDEIPF